MDVVTQFRTLLVIPLVGIFCKKKTSVCRAPPSRLSERLLTTFPQQRRKPIQYNSVLFAAQRETVKERSGSGCFRLTSHREDRYMVRNARIQPNASSAAVQAQLAPSLGAPVSSRTIRRCLVEEHLGSECPLRMLPLTPTHRRLLEWCQA
ncbi:transposable element Tcb2 transposase [Trichonephila clavipes]|nr:transposable element Tcb2 transposase [Trichonephila clavipes]